MTTVSVEKYRDPLQSTFVETVGKHDDDDKLYSEPYNKQEHQNRMKTLLSSSTFSEVCSKPQRSTKTRFLDI